MAQPYVGEIRMFASDFAPAGWMFCEGQSIEISENETLFTVIGTTYGGDGQNTFNLPDLRGRIPVHQGSGLTLGVSGGAEEVTISVNQMPAHTHPLQATSSPGSSADPANGVVAKTTTGFLYINEDTTGNMSAACIGPAGGGQPHANVQPFLCVSFIISLYGIFPRTQA